VKAVCLVEDLAGRPEAALARARRHPGDHPQLRLREARLLLRLDRHAEAEACARPLAADGDVQWPAVGVLVRSLLGQGRQPEAEKLLAEYEMDLEDLDD
jgi:hypothetical protein